MWWICSTTHRYRPSRAAFACDTAGSAAILIRRHAVSLEWLPRMFGLFSMFYSVQRGEDVTTIAPVHVRGGNITAAFVSAYECDHEPRVHATRDQPAACRRNGCRARPKSLKQRIPCVSCRRFLYYSPAAHGEVTCTRGRHNPVPESTGPM